MKTVPPACETCDGEGYVDIVDDMGGVVGPAPCPNCSADDPLEAVELTFPLSAKDREAINAELDAQIRVVP